VSLRSQALPSLQAVPLLTFEYADVLTAGWHVSQMFEPLAASLGTQAPPKSQKPALSVGAEHIPVDELHVPAVWHESGAVHVTWLPAVHVPDWHVSLRSQALPSLQLVPFVTGVYVHWPETQVPVVQGFPLVHGPEHDPPSDPNPSWHVTVAPEFMRTCAAAIAPVNFDVFTVTSVLVATRSACTWASELRLIPDDVSK
jgi:hypothetical protein